MDDTEHVDKKRFGIRITLREDDPMGLPHLLGEDWEAFRWYATEQERDRAFEEIQEQLPNYRVGDYPSQVLTKVER